LRVSGGDGRIAPIEIGKLDRLLRLSLDLHEANA
jgi:hypothetical protein